VSFKLSVACLLAIATCLLGMLSVVMLNVTFY
jgi:hypothetical protein